MATPEWSLATVASVIDIAVAPVFLLAGISGLLVVLTNRLGRTIDRSRSLQAAESEFMPEQHKQSIQREMGSLLRRVQLNHVAIGMATLSAVLVVTLFLGSLLQTNVSGFVAGLFIVCMIILSLAFSAFLFEVLISIRMVRASLVHTETFRSAERASPDRPQQD